MGCSQKSLTRRNRRAWDQYPQVNEGSAHTCTARSCGAIGNRRVAMGVTERRDHRCVSCDRNDPAPPGARQGSVRHVAGRISMYPSVPLTRIRLRGTSSLIHHAATGSYSWIRPPRASIRRTRGTSGELGHSRTPSGVRRSRPLAHISLANPDPRRISPSREISKD